MFCHPGMNGVESMDIPMEDYSSRDLFLEVVTRLQWPWYLTTPMFCRYDEVYVWDGV
jgi:hypothetical protein